MESDAFTPLVFSTSGGMGRECTVFYKRLADLFSRKRDKVRWAGCDFMYVFAALVHQPFQETNITLASVEGGRVKPDSDLN